MHAIDLHNSIPALHPRPSLPLTFSFFLSLSPFLSPISLLGFQAPLLLCAIWKCSPCSLTSHHLGPSRNFLSISLSSPTQIYCCLCIYIISIWKADYVQSIYTYRLICAFVFDMMDFLYRAMIDFEYLNSDSLIYLFISAFKFQYACLNLRCRTWCLYFCILCFWFQNLTWLHSSYTVIIILELFFMEVELPWA